MNEQDARAEQIRQRAWAAIPPQQPQPGFFQSFIDRRTEENLSEVNEPEPSALEQGEAERQQVYNDTDVRGNLEQGLEKILPIAELATPQSAPQLVTSLITGRAMNEVQQQAQDEAVRRFFSSVDAIRNAMVDAWKQSNELAEINPIALTGTPMEEGYTTSVSSTVYTPAPMESPEQAEVRYERKAATDEVVNEVSPYVKTLALPVIAAAFPEVALAAGSVMGTVATVEWLYNMYQSYSALRDTDHGIMSSAALGAGIGTAQTVENFMPGLENAKEKLENPSGNIGADFTDWLIKSSDELAFLAALGIGGKKANKGKFFKTLAGEIDDTALGLIPDIDRAAGRRFYESTSPVRDRWEKFKRDRTVKATEKIREEVKQKVDKDIAKEKEEFAKRTEKPAEKTAEGKKEKSVKITDDMEVLDAIEKEKQPVNIQRSELRNIKDRSGMTDGEVYDAIKNPAIIAEDKNGNMYMAINLKDKGMSYMRMRYRTNSYVLEHAEPKVFEKVYNEGTRLYSDNDQILSTVLKTTPADDVALPQDLENVRYSLSKVQTKRKPPTGLGKPTSRKELNRAVSDIVETKWGGKKSWRNRLAGFYDEETGVARVTDIADYETAAHEIGHPVYDELGMELNHDELIPVSKKLWGRRKKFKEMTDAEKAEEGFAEFMRQMLNDREGIDRRFPETYRQFTEKLKDHPDLARKLDVLEKAINNYHNQPVYARGMSGMSASDDVIPRKMSTQIRDFGRFMYTGLWDSLAPIKYAVEDMGKVLDKEILMNDENPYAQARIAPNSSKSQFSMFRNLQEDDPAKIVAAINEYHYESMKNPVTIGYRNAELKKIDISDEVLDRNGMKDKEQMFGVYWRAKDIESIRKKYPKYTAAEYTPKVTERIIDSAPEGFEDIIEIQKQINENLIDLQVAEGTLTAKEAEELKAFRPYYSPMTRDIAMEDAVTVVKGVKRSQKKFIDLDRQLRKLSAEGSELNVLDPIEAYDKYAQGVFDLVARNKVAQKFVAIAEMGDKAHPLGQFLLKRPELKGQSDPARNIFSVWTDGKSVSWETTPEIHEALENLGSQTFPVWWNIVRWATELLRWGATSTPAFGLTNASRDTITAAGFSRNGQFVPFVDSLRGVQKLVNDQKIPLTDKRFYTQSAKNRQYELEFMAGGVPMSTLMSVERVDMPFRQSAKWQRMKKANPAYRAADVIWGAVDGAAKKVQDFNQVIEEAPRFMEFVGGRERGKSATISALDAKELTLDFSRGGIWSKMLNTALPFFNAAMQGLDKIPREIANRPLTVGARMTSLIFFPKLYEYIMFHDDEGYKEIPDYILDNNIILGKTDGTFWRVPYPQEYAPLAAAFGRMLRSQFSGDEHAWDNYVLPNLDTITPDLNFALFMPTIQVMTNYDFFRGGRIVPQSMEKLSPELQANVYTSMFARWFGQAFNVSPMKVDRWISAQMGSVGTSITELGDLVIGRDNPKPARYWTEIEGIRRFAFTEGHNSRSLDRFWTTYNETLQDVNSHDRNAKNWKIWEPMKNTQKQLSDLNKRISKIANDSRLDESQKRDQINVLMKRQIKLAQDFNRKYNP